MSDNTEELSAAEAAALEAAQNSFVIATLQSQVEYLSSRVSELVRENVRMKEDV